MKRMNKFEESRRAYLEAVTKHKERQVGLFRKLCSYLPLRLGLLDTIVSPRASQARMVLDE